MDDDQTPVPVPDGWTAERSGGTVTLQSPDTCFWTLTAVPDGPEPAAAVETALDALREEYDDLDAAPVPGTPLVPGEAARDAEFFVLDATAAARVRAFRTAGVTYLIFYQGTDRDLEQRRDELEALGKQAWRGIAAAGRPTGGAFGGAGGFHDGASSEFPPALPR